MAENHRLDPVERLISLGHLSSGVGHHVINALSAIVSNAELLRLDPPMVTPADPAVLAETIIQTALEAATVARRLIDYTRPVTSTEPDRAAFPADAVSLDRLAAAVVEAEAERDGPEIRWETSLEPVPPIRGHEAQLRAMLAHLIQNSREAITPPTPGAIRLSTGIDARGWIALEVHDNGHGMDASVMPHAVEPFYSSRPGHLGVGLSIANGIWRRHRGTLSIKSHPGEGTLVRLCVEPARNGA